MTNLLFRLLGSTLHYLPYAGLLTLALSAGNSYAGAREQALQIHNRIAGVPPSPSVLAQMTAEISASRVSNAVSIAMENEAFYSVTLKNLATPWTNRDRTVFAPLNDYTATVIGLVKNDEDFRTLLYGDTLYTSNAPGLPAYSINNNAHYEAIEAQGISRKYTLIARDQTSLNGIPAEATSGVITSRAPFVACGISPTSTRRAIILPPGSFSRLC